MKFLKKQNYEERLNAAKEWLKSNAELNEMLESIFDFSRGQDKVYEEVIKEYFKFKNTKDYSEEMLMNAKGMNVGDFKRFIKLTWLDDQFDQPWGNEEEICEQMGWNQVYVGEGMWWDNVNKRHYSED